MRTAFNAKTAKVSQKPQKESLMDAFCGFRIPFAAFALNCSRHHGI
jgi:hypothetical protein